MEENEKNGDCKKNTRKIKPPFEAPGPANHLLAMQAEDRMKPHRVLFDFLFPLDRYAAMHFLQNILVFDSETETREILSATKLFIIQNIILMNRVVESGFAKPKNAMSNMMDNVGGKPGIGDIWAMIWESLLKTIEQAAFGAIRKTADMGDPAYKDMKKQYMDDPCAMKSGLRPGILGGPMLDGWNQQYENNRLKNGFGKKNGCKVYVPVNMFPLDLMFSIVPSGVPPFINIPKTARNMATTAEHFINLFPIEGLPVDRDMSKRYGHLLTPVGMLGLSVGELTGEEHARLKREQGCEESCKDEPGAGLVEPMSLCEDLDQEGEED